MAKDKTRRLNPFLDDLPEWWEEDWQGMPEFIQEDHMPFKTLIVHFKNKQDMSIFSKLVEQRITIQTKTIWYPRVDTQKRIDTQYIDEE